ncbi:30S ribosomal protein S21, chloroplastic-like [Senna tora]|uniref:30S ribosomal protein S21, chloroplastic-like n=1 Tax=Senna tora TaxID=362788 RepID=A0A834T0K2_9FABA|nr:30S ribosomal protein S21, chloroplastic-like [Senna tora]
MVLVLLVLLQNAEPWFWFCCRTQNHGSGSAAERRTMVLVLQQNQLFLVLQQNQKWFCCSSHGSAAEPVPWSGSAAEPWLGKRRRFFENHHDKKKRKARDAARRNRKSAGNMLEFILSSDILSAGTMAWMGMKIPFLNPSAERFCTVEPILQCRTDSAESPILQNGSFCRTNSAETELN